MGHFKNILKGHEKIVDNVNAKLDELKALPDKDIETLIRVVNKADFQYVRREFCIRFEDVFIKDLTDRYDRPLSLEEAKRLAHRVKNEIFKYEKRHD